MNEILKQILMEAGNIALLAQQNLTIDLKNDKSIVTNGDIAVSNFLEKELAKLYPDHQILSEENSSVNITSKKVIIIDPIDGTESFSRKQDSWSILIGFLDNMEIVGGVVYQPTIDKLYFGFKGNGAYLLDKGVLVSLKLNTNKDSLKAVTSKSDYGEVDYFNKLGITDIEQSYSAALKVMQVATGSADIYANFRKKCSIWDLIAPLAILYEVGGQFKTEGSYSFDLKKHHVDQKFICFNKKINVKSII